MNRISMMKILSSNLFKVRSFLTQQKLLCFLLVTSLICSSCFEAPKKTSSSYNTNSVSLELSSFSLSDERLIFSAFVINSFDEAISVPASFICHDLAFRLEFFEDKNQPVDMKTTECKTSLSEMEFVEIKANGQFALSFNIVNPYASNVAPSSVKLTMYSFDYLSEPYQKQGIDSVLWIGTVQSNYFEL